MSDRKIHVLDHGYVRLVDSMGGDVSVARAARVSYDAAWRAGEDEGGDARLIDYLWRNKHTTPFEAVTFQFEVKAPIFVLRQWHRHRTWSYNEVSARYKELPHEFYVPGVNHVGVQSKSNKQGREMDSTGEAFRGRASEIDRLLRAHRAAFVLYDDLIARNWPRELARTVLPIATYSHMFATVNLLNLLKFLTLRLHPHAQYETRVYAEAMRELIRPVVPVCLAAWERHSATTTTRDSEG